MNWPGWLPVTSGVIPAVWSKKARGIAESDATTITFIDREENFKKAEASAAAVVIVPMSVKTSSKTIIRVNNPRLAYAKIAAIFVSRPFYQPGIAATAEIAASARIGENVSIHPQVIIGEKVTIADEVILAPGVYVGPETTIGAHTLLHPRVVIGASTEIGQNVIIQAGSVIGADGYGYVSTREGHYKIPQQGRVVIADDVEIGANVTVDRATSGETVIGQGTKVDNLVQIAHNVEIGAHNLIVAQTGIAGSAKLGDRVILAGQSGISDHVTLADETTVATNSVVTKNIKEAGMYSGNPAQKHQQELKKQALERKLPELAKKIKKFRKAAGCIKK